MSRWPFEPMRSATTLSSSRDAAVDEAAPPALEMPRYIEKYAAEIARLGSNPEEFSAGYSVPIRIRPTRLRA
jgi:hypothetical protein